MTESQDDIEFARTGRRDAWNPFWAFVCPMAWICYAYIAAVLYFSK